MSGGGGKGGSQESSVEIDPRLERGAVAAASGALQSAGLRYSPNREETIAAFTPTQIAAFRGANQASDAFGLRTRGDLGIPDPTQNRMGISGYATGGLYDDARNNSIRPDQQKERHELLKYYRDEGKGMASMAPPPDAGGGK